MNNNFASNLKHLRIQSGMTQEDLAKKLDKDYSTIGKWELGQRSPIMVDVIKVSELFNVPLETLINGSVISDAETTSNLNDTEQLKQFQLLFSKIKDLPEESQKMIYNVTKSVMDEIDKQLDGKDS